MSPATREVGYCLPTPLFLYTLIVSHAALLVPQTCDLHHKAPLLDVEFLGRNDSVEKLQILGSF
jgi:hypothetical protein